MGTFIICCPSCGSYVRAKLGLKNSSHAVEKANIREG